AESDAAGAGQWLKALPPGTSRDAAVSSYAQALVQFYPESALHWAETIGDKEARGSQIQALATRWIGIDYASARTWVLASNLPDSVKKSILEQPREAGEDPLPNPPAF